MLCFVLFACVCYVFVFVTEIWKTCDFIQGHREWGGDGEPREQGGDGDKCPSAALYVDPATIYGTGSFLELKSIMVQRINAECQSNVGHDLELENSTNLVQPHSKKVKKINYNHFSLS